MYRKLGNEHVAITSLENRACCSLETSVVLQKVSRKYVFDKRKTVIKGLIAKTIIADNCSK